MLELRPASCKSWWDKNHAYVKAANLAARLTREVRSEHCVAITLTYAREPWANAKECLDDSMSDAGRHVQRFIERLTKAMRKKRHDQNYSLTGRWFCKMEFQKDGFVHWHILIRGERFLQHQTIAGAWGWGFVWVDAGSEAVQNYLCKYLTKDNAQLPEFIYHAKTGSLRVARVSPGFWSDTIKRKASKPRWHIKTRYGGRCIGAALERAANRTEMRHGVIYGATHARMSDLLPKLQPLIAGSKDGWLRVDAGTFDVERIALRLAEHRPAPLPEWWTRAVLAQLQEYDPTSEVIITRPYVRDGGFEILIK